MVRPDGPHCDIPYPCDVKSLHAAALTASQTHTGWTSILLEGAASVRRAGTSHRTAGCVEPNQRELQRRWGSMAPGSARSTNGGAQDGRRRRLWRYARPQRARLSRSSSGRDALLGFGAVSQDCITPHHSCSAFIVAVQNTPLCFEIQLSP